MLNGRWPLVGAFSVIVKTGCGTDGALHSTTLNTTMRLDTLLSEKSFEGRIILGYRLIQLIHWLFNETNFSTACCSVQSIVNCQLCEGDTDTGHGHGDHTLVFIFWEIIIYVAVRLKISKLFLQMHWLKILSSPVFYSLSKTTIRNDIYLSICRYWYVTWSWHVAL